MTYLEAVLLSLLTVRDSCQPRLGILILIWFAWCYAKHILESSTMQENRQNANFMSFLYRALLASDAQIARDILQQPNDHP